MLRMVPALDAALRVHGEAEEEPTPRPALRRHRVFLLVPENLAPIPIRVALLRLEGKMLQPHRVAELKEEQVKILKDAKVQAAQQAPEIAAKTKKAEIDQSFLTLAIYSPISTHRQDERHQRPTKGEKNGCRQRLE